MPGNRPDDSAGPLLPSGEEVEETPEGTEQHDADCGGHQDQDRGRGRTVTMQPGWDVKPVQHEERHQREPEDDVQHDG